jgi:hypothetical protein
VPPGSAAALAGTGFRQKLFDILRARILAIACGYEDADDFDYLRSDPALKLAAASGQRARSVFAADHVALRECAELARKATTQGLDIRYVVTSFTDGSTEWLYDSLDCGRGQAENLIKLHKSQLASDRTSCRSALANRVPLVLHTAAYWLMLTLRDATPKPQPLALAEFATLHARLLKIAAKGAGEPSVGYRKRKDRHTRHRR